MSESVAVTAQAIPVAVATSQDLFDLWTALGHALALLKPKDYRSGPDLDTLRAAQAVHARWTKAP